MKCWGGGEACTNRHWMMKDGALLLQYRSNFVDLRWVMPQCLAPWLVIVLWWEHWDKIQDYVSLMLPVFLNGAFSFVGLAIIAVICAIIVVFNKQISIKEWIGRVLSKQNILSAFVIGVPLIFYYSGNVFYPKPESVGFSFQILGIGLYISFILAHFGIYCLLAWKVNKDNGIFWGTVIALLLFPFIHMGMFNDFVMCSSIPGMFVVMICVTRYIFEFPKTAATGALIVLLFVGAINPLKEMGDVVRVLHQQGIGSGMSVETLELYSDLESDDLPMKYNYFSYNVDKNIFIKYIAKSSW